MILRLRQLCCHPNLILVSAFSESFKSPIHLNFMQSLAEDYADPTMLLGSDADKELARATKVMGAAWVAKVCSSFNVHVQFLIPVFLKVKER
jgi:hypothetical protein